MDTHIFDGVLDISRVSLLTIVNILLANLVTMTHVDLYLSIALKLITILSMICTTVYTLHKFIKLLKE
jgi:hypothetical protein